MTLWQDLLAETVNRANLPVDGVGYRPHFLVIQDRQGQRLLSEVPLGGDLFGFDVAHFGYNPRRHPVHDRIAAHA
jgi:hypothetical protein